MPDCLSALTQWNDDGRAGAGGRAFLPPHYVFIPGHWMETAICPPDGVMTSQSRAQRRRLFLSFFFFFFFFCPLFMSSAAAGCATGGRTDCFDMRRSHRGRLGAFGLLEAPEMASDSASAGGGPSSFPGCLCSFDFMQRLRKDPAIQIVD